MSRILDALRFAQEHAPARLHEIGGRVYSDKDLKEYRPKRDRVKEPLVLHSLDGLLEWPVCDFVVRAVGGGESKPPTVGLFEVADGHWRREAVERVVSYLRTAYGEATGSDAHCPQLVLFLS